MTPRMTMGIAAVALLSACTATADEPMQSASAQDSRRDCFYLSQVTGFNSAGRDQIYVSTGPNDVYLFKTMGHCPDLNFSQNIGFDQAGPGQICSGLDVDLIVPSTIGPQRCPVSMIRKLTPEERAAR